MTFASPESGPPSNPLVPKPASESKTIMSVVMEIEHANYHGFVHGGEIMRLVDTCAGIAAARHCKRRVVTASMDEMSFLIPVHLGELVTIRAMVNDAHRTSMEVGVRVDVENIQTGEIAHVSSAYLVFVGVDADGHPTPVPPVAATTEDERRRQAQARIRREQRLATKEALRRAIPPAGTA